MDKKHIDTKERVVFYLNSLDKVMLDSKANITSVSTSFYVRNLVLDDLGKRINKPKTIPIDSKKYLAELFAQGSNINQIARSLNSGNKFLITDQITVLNQIELLTNQIIEIKDLMNNG